MVKIGLLSDTHGFLDPKITRHFNDCDEIWHAGDIGSLAILDALRQIAPVRAVYGNIDGHLVRRETKESLTFYVEGVSVYICHIGGYPGRYASGVREKLINLQPDLFISGHSHILKVVRDKRWGWLHMNPGACGLHGFQKVRTILRFSIDGPKIQDVEAIELAE